MQPPIQSLQQVAPPYAMDLHNTASAAGYWADRLGAEEQQRSYLVMQQVHIIFTLSHIVRFICLL